MAMNYCAIEDYKSVGKANILPQYGTSLVAE